MPWEQDRLILSLLDPRDSATKPAIRFDTAGEMLNSFGAGCRVREDDLRVWNRCARRIQHRSGEPGTGCFPLRPPELRSEEQANRAKQSTCGMLCHGNPQQMSASDPHPVLW